MIGRFNTINVKMPYFKFDLFRKKKHIEITRRPDNRPSWKEILMF